MVQLKILNGVDIVEVARIKKSMQSPRFMANIYSIEEREYLEIKSRPEESAAGFFAAKEAFLKAVQTGIKTMDLHNISVSHNDNGAPFFVLSGWAKDSLAGRDISLSISHTSENAIAFVTIIETD